MDWTSLKEFFTIENLLQYIEQYKSIGPILGISLPLLEAFLPFLPLFVFVMVNATAYGLWFGFLLSWVGSVAGSLLLFVVLRRYGQKRFFSFLNEHPKVKRSINWVERKGFGPIFVLYSFPFSPSSLISLVSALSRLSIKQFILAVCLGKFIMIFTISYIGQDLLSFLHKPVKAVIALIVITIAWYVGKKIEVYLEIK